MLSTDNSLQRIDEVKKIFLLCRAQRMALEKRDDVLSKINNGPNNEPIERLAMVILPRVVDDRSAMEELTEDLERFETPLPLRYGKLREDLPSEATGSIPENADRKAPLPIGESNDPTDQSLLSC